MLIDAAKLNAIFTAFNTLFNKGVTEAKPRYRDVAMVIPSSTAEETYTWLGSMPGIREWIGSRIIHNLSLHGYAIKNRDFEATVSVSRNHIDDDRYGVFGPIFEKMGADAARHPDELVFSLLKAGASTPCYDGQNFFDTDHPVGSSGGILTSGSNRHLATGNPADPEAGIPSDVAGPTWYLLDCSQPIKPLIYQQRRPYNLVRKDREEDDNVFWMNDIVYGSFGRSNVGFGLWQLAFSSNKPLTEANFEAARIAMGSHVSDAGKPLNVSPTHLVVPPALEGPARRVVAPVTAAGGFNTWAGAAEVITSPYLT